MGPGDPFAKKARTPVENATAHAPSPPDPARRSHTQTQEPEPTHRHMENPVNLTMDTTMTRTHWWVLGGLVLGLGFGTLTLVTSLGQSLAVLGFGLGGAVLARLVAALLFGELDFARALRALLKKDQ